MQKLALVAAGWTISLTALTSLPALAQTLAPSFAGSAAPAGMIDLGAGEPAPGYTLAAPAQPHGVLTTGIGTNGAAEVGGAVVIPIAPGAAELEVGGGTSQIGLRLPPGSGRKTALARSSGGYAALRLHPSADVQLDLSVSEESVKLPAIGPAH